MKGEKMIYLLLFSVLFLPAMAFLSFILIHITPLKDSRTSSNVVSEADLTMIIQEWRLSQGLKRYTLDPKLCDFANKRANEIFIEKNNMSHDGIWKYKSQLLDTYDGFSENLARNWSPELMLDWWLHSASHEANLRRDRPLTCVKCKGYYCVQLFATPK